MQSSDLGLIYSSYVEGLAYEMGNSEMLLKPWFGCLLAAQASD